MTSSDLRPLNGPEMRMPRSAWWSAFSHDGSRLYTSGDDSHIWVWDVKTSRLMTRIKTSLDLLCGPDLHPSLEQVAAGGTDGTVRVWDIATGEELLCTSGHRGTAIAARFADEGRKLLSAGADGTVRLKEATSGKGIGRLKRLGSRVHGLACHRTTARYGAVFFRGVRVWDRDLKDVFRFDGIYHHGGEGQSDLALPGEGDVLWVTFRKEPYLRVWDLKGADTRPRCIELGEPAFKLAFSPDETMVAVSLYREIVLIRAETFEVIARWKAPCGTEKVQSPVCGLSFSPDGRVQASTDVGGGIWLWPLPTAT